MHVNNNTGMKMNNAHATKMQLVFRRVRDET